jgi:GNAT superfamily N-acetyltransferase
MTIRRADADDASAVAVVHVRSWQAAYLGLMPQDFLDGLDPDQRAAVWRQRLAEPDWPRTGVLVAEDAGQVVGFSAFCPARDDDLDPARVGDVAAIYLVPSAWGQGHGRRLMTASLAALGEAGYREAALWVLDTNKRARTFYGNSGWAADGAVKQDQLPGADFTITEVRYRRPLP